MSNYVKYEWSDHHSYEAEMDFHYELLSTNMFA